MNLRRVVAVWGALIVLGSVGAGAAQAKSGDQELAGYARTTWASFVAMTDEQSGLPADSLRSDGTRSVQTSTTNIGAYLWSTIVAARLGIISHAEEVGRVEHTISTLERMEPHEASGQFYNWYDHRTG